MKKTTFFNLLAWMMTAMLLCLSFSACKQEEPAEEESHPFSILVGNVEVALGAEAEPILAKLGEAQSVQEVFDCGAGNSRMWYRYASFDVYVMKTEAGETVDQIEIHDDLITTSDGIGIGSSVSEARETYGDYELSEQEGRLVYSKGDLHIALDVANQTVTDLMLKRTTR